MANEIPPLTRRLGAEILAYVLNTCQNKANALIRGSSPLSAERMCILNELEQNLAESLPASMQADSYSDPPHLNDPSILFDLRAKVGGKNSGRPTEDGVQDAIARMCDQYYFPFSLLPVSRWENAIGSIRLPQTFGTDLHSNFMTAARSDTSLRKLYTENDFSGSRPLYTSFGTHGSMRLELLHQTIILAGITVMHAQGKSGAAELQSAALKMLTEIRGLSEGKHVELPVIETFDLFGIPEAVKLSIRGAKLSAVPREFLRHIPEAARPAKDADGRVSGCMLTRMAKFSVSRSALREGPPDSGEWPGGISYGNDELRELVSTATGLAFDDGLSRSDLGASELVGKYPALAQIANIAARWRSITTIDPIQGATSWVQPVDHSNSTDSRRAHLASEEECQKLYELMTMLEGVDFSRIQLAARRFLKAAIDRTDPEDSLIDAVIGLESLFGSQKMNTLSIKDGVSKLLGNTNAERNEIFEGVGKIYNARCDVVHGREMNRQMVNDVSVLRKLALHYLQKCLGELLTKEQNLIDLDSEKRVKFLRCAT